MSHPALEGSTGSSAPGSPLGIEGTGLGLEQWVSRYHWAPAWAGWLWESEGIMRWFGNTVRQTPRPLKPLEQRGPFFLGEFRSKGGGHKPPSQDFL